MDKLVQNNIWLGNCPKSSYVKFYFFEFYDQTDFLRHGEAFFKTSEVSIPMADWKKSIWDNKNGEGGYRENVHDRFLGFLALQKFDWGQNFQKILKISGANELKTLFLGTTGTDVKKFDPQKL